MQATENPNHTSQGFRLNLQTWPAASDWPEWTNRYQREKWEKKGLILWDGEIQHVTRLSGQQALGLLDQLRRAADWQAQGCVVGELAWQLSSTTLRIRENLYSRTQLTWLQSKHRCFSISWWVKKNGYSS